MSPLLEGEIIIEGRIMPASNHTFYGRIGGVAVVYKPTAGERPLWDFADGTLALREYAAFLVSDALGWGIVPETLLREGPAGPGMVQRWCEPDGDDVVDVVPRGAVPDGWLHVLDAVGGNDEPVSLVHEDSNSLRQMALFDVITNNTDRKAGHILSMADGRRLGVDHGICFHSDDKLRTVLWGWAGARITEAETAGLRGLLDHLDAHLGEQLRPLLAEEEITSTRQRLEVLLSEGTFPRPSQGWPSIPWPPF